MSFARLERNELLRLVRNPYSTRCLIAKGEVKGTELDALCGLEVRRAWVDLFDASVGISEKKRLFALLKDVFMDRAEQISKTFDHDPWLAGKYRELSRNPVVAAIMIGGYYPALLSAAELIRMGKSFDAVLIGCPKSEGRAPFRSGRNMEVGRIYIAKPDLEFLALNTRRQVLMVDDALMHGITKKRVSDRLFELGYENIAFSSHEVPQDSHYGSLRVPIFMLMKKE